MGLTLLLSTRPHCEVTAPNIQADRPTRPHGDTVFIFRTSRAREDAAAIVGLLSAKRNANVQVNFSLFLYFLIFHLFLQKVAYLYASLRCVSWPPVCIKVLSGLLLLLL